MNAKRVQLEDGTKLDCYRCSTCGMIYRESEPRASVLCCRCQDCGVEIDPKKESRSHLCSKCWGPHYAKIDADRLKRATELTDYDGPVFIGVAGMDELGKFLFPIGDHLTQRQLLAVFENYIENGNVEDGPSVEDFDGSELRAAVEKFNEANKDKVYWIEDSKHKVRVPVEGETYPPSRLDTNGKGTPLQADKSSPPTRPLA